MPTAEECEAAEKYWELTSYELARKPRKLIVGDTEICIHPKSLRTEMMCPICLNILKKTMITKQCLHRFCYQCIMKALRSGNKECPTCRQKLMTKRSLKLDERMDTLIASIFPDGDECKAPGEEALTVQSITQGIEQLIIPPPSNGSNANCSNQSSNTTANVDVNTPATNVDSDTPCTSKQVTESAPQNVSGTGTIPKRKYRKRGAGPRKYSLRSRENTEGEATGVKEESKVVNKKSVVEEPSAIVKEETDIVKVKSEIVNEESKIVNEAKKEINKPLIAPLDEVEIIMRPHANLQGVFRQDDGVRFLKVSSDTTVDHLKQYLAIRDRVDFEVTQPLDPQQISMYLALPPARVLHLGGTMTMQKIEKVIYNNGKILHMQYSWPRQ